MEIPNIKKARMPSPRRAVQPVVDYKQQFVDNLVYIRRTMSNVRMIFTIFIISWVIAVAICLMKQDEQSDNEQQNSRYYYLHRIFFGDESPLFMLFRMWIYAFVFYLLTPLFGEILIVLRAKSF